jgi:hypothetical protein
LLPPERMEAERTEEVSREVVVQVVVQVEV